MAVKTERERPVLNLQVERRPNQYATDCQPLTPYSPDYNTRSMTPAPYKFLGDRSL